MDQFRSCINNSGRRLLYWATPTIKYLYARAYSDVKMAKRLMGSCTGHSSSTNKRLCVGLGGWMKNSGIKQKPRNYFFGVLFFFFCFLFVWTRWKCCSHQHLADTISSHHGVIMEPQKESQSGKNLVRMSSQNNRKLEQKFQQKKNNKKKPTSALTGLQS